jgi:hypothetical protein
MARLMIFVGPLVFAFWVFCVITVLMSRDDDVGHLPKIGWLILVLFFPLVGGVAWLLIGREGGQPRASPYERAVPQFPEYDRPGRASGLTPESDEEFLRRIRERAEEQRRKAKETRPGEEPERSTD